jgi:hypothetical protein
MRNKLAIQLLGLLLFFAGAGGIIFSLATMGKVNYVTLALSIIVYGGGAALLVSPAKKEKKLYYFIALTLSPASFFGCFYLMDIGQAHGINLPFIGEVILSIMASALISFAIMFIPKITKIDKP